MKVDARTSRTVPPAGGRAARARSGSGFTIIELLVSILVIAILIGILIVAVTAAIGAGRRSGEQGFITGMQTGVGVFQNTFDNRLPPMVWDGAPIALETDPSMPLISGVPASAPVFPPAQPPPPPGTVRQVATYERIYQDGGAVLLQGHAPSNGTEPEPLFEPERDPRYSKFALPIFLMGSLGDDADGRAGPGMRLTYTNRGGWALGGQSEVREALFAASNESAVQTSYVSLDEYREHGRAAPAAGSPELAANPDRTAFVNGAGVAIRYYRWEASVESQVAGTQQGRLGFLNIPVILRDPRDWDDPDEPGPKVPQELRSARYALVGAGPNGLFGTEPLDLLRERLGIGPGMADEGVRYEAWRDNVVRVGK